MLVARRDQGFTVSGHRHETRHRVRIGAGRDGKFTAYHHALWDLNGRADRDPPIFMRSPSDLPVIFALESAVDELAVKPAMDPAELRRINDTDKNRVSGKPYSSRSLMACHDAASAALGWKSRNPGRALCATAIG